MGVKVPKYQCLSLEGSTGKLKYPQQLRGGVFIPFTEELVRYLGLDVSSRSDIVAMWLSSFRKASYTVADLVFEKGGSNRVSKAVAAT